MKNKVSNLTYDLEKAKNTFADFCQTIAQLRDPKTGCPWDLKQTHQSLRPYMIEEAYEASAAMAKDDMSHICEELGDVLLQVLLNAQLACDDKQFTIIDVIESINQKMITRHPHVFNRENNGQNPTTAKEVLSRWADIKKSEAQSKGKEIPKGILAGIASREHFPSTHLAYEIGKKSATVHFDWSHPNEVFDKLLSEVQELKEEWVDIVSNRKKIYDELGDVYFTLAQLCRHLEMNPEIVAQDGNTKFIRRFEAMEALAHQRGILMSEAPLGQLTNLWNEVKATSL